MTEQTKTLWLPEKTLSRDAYLKDFYPIYETMQDTFRKIEYGQTFAEPGNESYDAFIKGNWQEALKKQEERFHKAEPYFDGLKNGKNGLRVRIVDKPFSDYLIWELNFYKINERSGEKIKIISLNEAKKLVTPEHLDDFVTIDEKVAYRVIYGQDGINEAAEKTTDPASITGVIKAFERLFDKAEPFRDFFSREAAHLTPTNGL